MPSADKKKNKNIFKSIVNWFKHAADWVQENLGDPALARALREDLGLKPGADIPPGDKAKFQQFAAGLDPDKAAFDETVAEISALIPVFRALGEQLKAGDLDAADVSYLIAKVAVADSLKVRAPLIYSIAKILTLVTDDPDSPEMFDLDMLVKVIRDGTDTERIYVTFRTAQSTTQIDAFAKKYFLALDEKQTDRDFLFKLTKDATLEPGALVTKIISDESSVESAEHDLSLGRRFVQQMVPSAVFGLLELLLMDKVADPNFMDFYYGWDPAPGSATPIADTVASRAGTILLRLPPSGPAALALTIIHAPPEHGGHGLFLALNGTIEFQHKSERVYVSFKSDQTAAQIDAFAKKYALTLDEKFTERSFSFTRDSGATPPLDELLKKFQSDEPSVESSDSETFETDITSLLPGQLNLFVPLEKSARDAKFFAAAASSYLKMTFLLGSDQSPALRIGEQNKTRVDIAKVLLEVELSTERAALRFGFKGAKLIADLAKDGDEFISNVGGQSLQAGMDFVLVADTDGGLRVDGGAGFKATFPGGELLGGALTVHHIDVALGPGSNNRDLGLEISGAFAFRLGPFAGAIDRLGFVLDADFGDGNLGWLDLALGFKAPNGIGFVLDAAVVKGGGYLFMDAARGEYAGALELSIRGLGLKAIAILSTKMPDGSRGWSLLLMIYGQFPPIQLSWGFTLNGVGGMIGVQHGMNIEELKSGMRTGALDDILFPKNPVADAPRIINRLRAIFPATRRAIVVGPMIELGWGTPRLIQIRMGLLFQLDNAFSSDISLQRIVLLGQLVVQLPPEVDDKAVVLKLLVDFYGYYDFDLNRLEFAARLRDSSVLKLPLSGMLIVRAEFGDKPLFILSAGGFHPRFKDLPADLPAPIDRLEINLKIGRLKVRAQQYFAITPASVQSGAEIQVTAKIGPVDISGYLGYDAILHLEPRFLFEVDIRAGVAMKYKGHNLASVKLEFHLEGPGRWRAKGKASFSILFWDVGVHFDESWGDEPEIAPATTNVSQLMQKALSDKGNWRAQLPQGGESLVTLALVESTSGVLAHPLGELQVSQKVAPLGLELQRFGSTRVDGSNKFEVTQVTVGGQAIAQPTAATEFFARAQFVDMSDEQKLSAPSFEKFASGVTVGSDDYLAAPEVVAADLKYETAYLQPDDPVRRTKRAGVVSLGIGKAELFMQAQHGAAAKSKLRSTAALRPSDPRKVKVTEPPLAVTNADTHTSAMDLKDLSQTATTLAEQTARNALGKKAVGRSHVVVEAFELVK